MLGFGPIAGSAIGAIPGGVLRLTSDILTDVVTQFVERGALSSPPDELHHFTSLETAHYIIARDNIRLSHAEYSNDQTEMEEAKEIIQSRMVVYRANNPFYAGVETDYQNVAPTLDAYIFCTSTGGGGPLPQDMLSQWRGYGQDGKGICLTLAVGDLTRLVQNTPSLRLNPVIYERTVQIAFIDAILGEGLVAHTNGDPNARQATVAALVFATPLMKSHGFSEEREWRLIFMPPQIGIPLELNFHPRRDFLAPFLTLEQIWTVLRPAMLRVPDLEATLISPALRPSAHVPPLIPISSITIGPSGHQRLSERSMQKLIIQANRPRASVLTSKIPYRSLA
jgi:hypothetical protein